MDTARLSDALIEMTQKGLGFTAIVDQQLTLVGIFTDGDLRRVFASGENTQSAKVIDVMHANPTTIGAQKLAAEAVELMEQHKINGLLVTDEHHKLVGAFNMHDLLMAKII